MNHPDDRTPVLVGALVSAAINTADFVFGMMDFVVYGVAIYLAYQILGFVWFMALIVSPIVVSLFYNGFEAYDAIMERACTDDEDDYNDHFNDKLQ